MLNMLLPQQQSTTISAHKTKYHTTMTTLPQTVAIRRRCKACKNQGTPRHCTHKSAQISPQNHVACRAAYATHRTQSPISQDKTRLPNQQLTTNRPINRPTNPPTTNNRQQVAQNHPTTQPPNQPPNHPPTCQHTTHPTNHYRSTHPPTTTHPFTH